MSKSIDHVAGIMAGAGCWQQADRSWIARCGAMDTLRGHGATSDAALSALARKVRRAVANRDHRRRSATAWSWYRVSHGQAEECRCDAEADGSESVIVAAHSPKAAIAAAADYDDGKSAPDNVYCQVCNKSHAAIDARPPALGRPPVEHPRRRKINVMLTESEAARLDQVRGSIPAGTWIRDAILPQLPPVDEE